MNIFIIQGKSGIYPGIWMSRAKAETDREMVACAGVSGDVVEMVPASEVREKDELIQKLREALAPFADTGKHYNPATPSDQNPSPSIWCSDLTVGDLRRAAQVMKEIEG